MLEFPLSFSISRGINVTIDNKEENKYEFELTNQEDQKYRFTLDDTGEGVGNRTIGESNDEGFEIAKPEAITRFRQRQRDSL